MLTRHKGLTGEHVAVRAIGGGRDHDAAALGLEVLYVELPAALCRAGSRNAGSASWQAAAADNACGQLPLIRLFFLGPCTH